jgi:hypothetical protein
MKMYAIDPYEISGYFRPTWCATQKSVLLIVTTIRTSNPTLNNNIIYKFKPLLASAYISKHLKDSEYALVFLL